MAGTGLIIELDCLLMKDGLAADAQAQLKRMHTSQIVIGFVSQLSQPEAEAAYAAAVEGLDLPAFPVLGIADDVADKWRWPKAGQLLRMCKKHSADIFSSWIIANNHAAFKAASQAGFLGGVYIGEDMPADKCGLQVLNQALSVGDAPRVIIPPKGGCWHDK